MLGSFKDSYFDRDHLRMYFVRDPVLKPAFGGPSLSGLDLRRRSRSPSTAAEAGNVDNA